MTKQKIHLALGFATVCAAGVAVLLVVNGRGMGGVKFVRPKDGAECLIVNQHSGRCLTVAGGVGTPGAKIVQGPAPENAKPPEYWVLRRSGSGYKLAHRDTGHVLEVAGANPERGGLAILWTDSGRAAHQEWALTPVGSAYTLRAGHSWLVLAVAQSSSRDGATVLQWDRVDGADDQHWFLMPLP
jgi:hypothetical protein